MEWILLESLVALVILVAIVGWTMAPLRRRKTRARERRDPAAGTGPERGTGQ
jgi:hypothetical protein